MNQAWSRKKNKKKIDLPSFLCEQFSFLFFSFQPTKCHHPLQSHGSRVLGGSRQPNLFDFQPTKNPKMKSIRVFSPPQPNKIVCISLKLCFNGDHDNIVVNPDLNAIQVWLWDFEKLVNVFHTFKACTCNICMQKCYICKTHFSITCLKGKRLLTKQNTLFLYIFHLKVVRLPITLAIELHIGHW